MDDSGYLTMSRKELNRLEILNRVLERRLTQTKAAEQLGLSLRQVERLCGKLRLEEYDPRLDLTPRPNLSIPALRPLLVVQL